MNLGRHLRNIARASLGTPLIAVQHLCRQPYLARSVTWVDAFDEAPPVSGSVGDASLLAGPEVQRSADGVGPLVMRTYDCVTEGSRDDSARLLAQFRAAPNAFVPRHIAGFRTRSGEPSRDLAEGDEVVVEIPGPWNGPVRVASVDDHEIMLETLDGHMEAGHIRFTAEQLDDGAVRFRIRSWARAGDQAFRRLHLDARLALALQTAMWAHTCDRAIEISGGSRRGPIRVDTQILIGSETTRS